MTWLNNALRKMLHLFVADVRLAGATLAWLAIVWLGALTILPPVWRGMVLFAGLAGIVFINAWCRARRR